MATIDQRQKRNKAYWQRREMMRRAQLYNKVNSDLDAALADEYARVGKSLKREILALLEEIRGQDGVILPSDLWKSGRYFEMLNQINAELDRLGAKQIEQIEDALIDIYTKQSELSASEFGLYTTIDRNAARTVVNELWCADGELFSDRIWANKALLVDKLESSLFDFVAKGQPTAQLVSDLISEQMGVPISELTNILDDDFREAYNNARRLVRTETARIQNRATQDRLKDAGFTKYRVLAEPDCCEVCDDLSRQVFDIDDLVLPAHPNCRCAMVAITESLK